MLPNLLLLALTITTVLVSAYQTPQQQIQQESIKDDKTITSDTIRDNLIASKIIPEVLDDFEPMYRVNLVFYDPKRIPVALGNTIPVKQVGHRPIFLVPRPINTGTPTTDRHDSKKSDEQVFTLILTDPDATSRKNPKWSEMCHWVLTNISLHDSASISHIPFQMELQDNNSGKSSSTIQPELTELIEYLAPAPPKKTGLHRYVFVLLQGSSKLDVTPPSERKHWGYGKVRHGVRDWAHENGLKVVGANYFYAQHEK